MVLRLWDRLSLRVRILVVLCSLGAVAIAGNFILIWYTYRIQTLLASVIQPNVASLDMANRLEHGLLNQRGYVSYFVLDGDPVWLGMLEEREQEFADRLEEARQISSSQESRDILTQIESDYKRYRVIRNRVIELYKAGDRDAAARLHREARDQFLDLVNLCEEYGRFHKKALDLAWTTSLAQVTRLRIAAVTGMSCIVVACILLLFVLFTQILNPIRKLAIEAMRTDIPKKSRKDDVSALTNGVHGLIRDIGEHEKLERRLRESEAAYREASEKLDSQVKQQLEQLRQAESLATVGRMVSIVAHEIRNPVQNIQLGIETLSRLKMSESEKSEVLEDIQSGIDLLKGLVEDLLNYSKPIRLKCSQHPVGDLIGQALKRTEYRLRNIDTHLELEIDDRPIFVDPEKFTMVLVNLISNAVEAMSEKGRLNIRSRYVKDGGPGVVELVISDNGTGISKENLAKVYEPFFTTKARGTGLGIPICRKIVDVHGGSLNITSEYGEGTIVEITVPLAE